jgi:thiamine biosynthesis protein ThiS
MLVIVNGITHALPEPLTLAALLRLLSPPEPFAVARNAEVVPRGGYKECCVQSGDRIDIVHPAAGG